MNNKKIANDPRLGNIFFVDSDELIYKEIKDNGIFEKEVLSWLDKNVSEGMVCVNVGANIGYHAMIISSIARENGRVYAFEPSSIIFDVLKNNIESKKINNILLFKYAVGNSNGSVDIFFNEKNPGNTRSFNPKGVIDRYSSNYMDHGFSEDPPVENVKMIKLDDFIKEKVDLLFIDTEGYDIFVLQGAESIIKKYKPMIHFELTPDWLSSLDADWKGFIEEYLKYGYSISIIDQGGQEFLISSSIDIENYINMNGKFSANVAMIYKK